MSKKNVKLVDLRQTRPPDHLRFSKSQELPLRQILNGAPEISKSSSIADEILRVTNMMKVFCTFESKHRGKTKLDIKMKTDIDLHAYAIETGEEISDTMIQCLCEVQPNLTRLDLTNCGKISDVGLWAISRHCHYLQELVLSGCDTISEIGLRSLRECKNITSLDFTGCKLLDDLALTAVAVGSWKLKHLILKGCTRITDTGVSKVVKNSPYLETLILNGCTSVGEFGNMALIAIGTGCSQLKILDLVGCRRVEDGGLKTVAVGCENLEKLILSGCDTISGQSLRAICEHSKCLQTLVLNSCRQLEDRDLDPFHYDSSKLNRSLTSIDMSGCYKITDRGVDTLCRALGPCLYNLNIAGSATTDRAAPSIIYNCGKLRSLDLSHCRNITDDMVSNIATSVTALTTLKLDGTASNRVTMKRVMSHLVGDGRLEFADLATEWFGYKPKEKVEDLIGFREKHRLDTRMAIRMQCMFRKKKAFMIYKEARFWWLMNKVIPRAQAVVRGYFKRMIYKRMKFHQLQIRMAIRVQTIFRKHYRTMQRLKKHKLKLYKVFLHKMAALIQRYFWGMKGRRKANKQRVIVANERLAKAKLQALKEQSSTHISRVIRGFMARRLCKVLAKRRAEFLMKLAMHDRMRRLIQRIAFGKIGRMKAKRRRDELAHQALRWASAWQVQRVYRGHVGRLIAAEERRLREIRRRNRAANEVQRMFRGYRGRVLAGIARALAILRKTLQLAAVVLQRYMRGCLARIHIRHYRLKVERERLVLKSTLQIERIYRGHKGREVAEVERQLRAMDAQAQPLFTLIRVLEEDHSKLQRLVIRLEETLLRTEEELYEGHRELVHTMETTSKYTDCTRINNIPQRFLTKYLRIRLKDHLEHEEMLHKTRDEELVVKKVQLRDIKIKIEAARRELIPLTTGLVVHVKRDRTIRLRARVRLVRKSVVSIQSIFRRALVRMGYMDIARPYWIECFDEEQGESPYYYNTWSRQTNWKIPLAYRYFPPSKCAVALVE